MVTIPRAEIVAVMERYDDSWTLDSDPASGVVRHVVAEYRENADYADSDAERTSLLGEALALDALADRYEQEANA